MATPIKRKKVIIDPEGNKITTKTRKTNILGPKGATKVITKYANPASSGKKRDVQTFSAPKKEVDTSYKKGGTTKMKKYAMGGTSIPKAQLGRFLVKERPISDLNNAAKIADNTTVKEKKSGKSITKNHRSYMQTNGETANFKSRTVRNADGSVKKKNGWATPIVAKQKRGGAIKPLRKKQPGGMAGPITESDSNELDSMYPSSSSVRIPAAPKDYNEDSEIWGYGGKNDPVDYEMKGRMANEKGIRSSPDFNNGSVYKKGGMTKKYKTGGMVNANSKITAAKKATGKSGGTTKAISKVVVKSTSPKGKVGGTSKAPKKASPVKLGKAKMGGAKGKC